jgi:cytoskeletal protein RodZ
MTDFGGKLRLARERRGISVREIAARTKISIAALEALERNDVSKLPGGIFSRAFVRSYAHEVGLDPDETVREFLARFQGAPAETVPAPAVASEADSDFDVQQRIAGVVLKLALISVPLVGLVMYFTLRPPPVPVPRPVETSEAEPAAVPTTGLQPAQIARSSGPQPAPTPAGVAPAPKTMTLELHPTGDCWIQLTVDGQPVVSRLMVAGDKEVRQVRDIAVIQVGDAGTFAFSIDGRSGKRLGQSGQVRTARITRDTVAQYLQ